MKNEKWKMPEWMKDIFETVYGTTYMIFNEVVEFSEKARSAGLLYTQGEIKNKLVRPRAMKWLIKEATNQLQADLTAERERAKELATKLEECQAELEKCRENKNKAARLLANASKRYHELDDELEKVKEKNERLRKELRRKTDLKTEASDKGSTE